MRFCCPRHCGQSDEPQALAVGNVAVRYAMKNQRITVADEELCFQAASSSEVSLFSASGSLLERMRVSICASAARVPIYPRPTPTRVRWASHLSVVHRCSQPASDGRARVGKSHPSAGLFHVPKAWDWPPGYAGGPCSNTLMACLKRASDVVGDEKRRELVSRDGGCGTGDTPVTATRSHVCTALVFVRAGRE